MNLTDKQKKGLWIVAGALVIIHFFLPGIVTAVRHAFTHTAPPCFQSLRQRSRCRPLPSRPQP